MIKSNDRQVALSQVDLATSGRYRCEVSAEGPAFQTVTDHGNMQVVGEYEPTVPSSRVTMSVTRPHPS